METAPAAYPLNAVKVLRGRMIFNRIFALLYAFAIAALLYRHVQTLLRSTASPSFFIHFSMLVADVILAFMWSTAQSYRMRQVTRTEFLGNLEKAVIEEDFPAMDIFICTADPFKEPPMDVVNTALSVMAYDYPPEKISVYVSDDGGSELTLFAFMEAAKFAAHWLPFCRENGVVDRCPAVFFQSACNGRRHTSLDNSQDYLKMMYDNMKERVQHVCEIGMISEEYITDEEAHKIFEKYRTPNFTSQNHHTIIQVLLESASNKDTRGHSMPNLVYVSREKSKSFPHHFKGGALNTLASDAWVLVYVFLFIGANTQHCYDFISTDGTFQRWWSDQRMWLMRALSSYLFVGAEFIINKQVRIPALQGFNLTSKVVDKDQGKRYEQGLFEFGMSSPLFVPLATAAIINVVAFIKAATRVIISKGECWDMFMIQMFLASYGVLNAWPIFQGMMLRSDNGRMPTMITITSSCIATIIYVMFTFWM
ncbi:unnamed protein product [Cuscuta epithymum]|uniref:Cellulose synthase-like protein G3 n=1 Tax=Cuscuta epithymum TaxID=186058 RepID=A0AAV0BZX0_9ASTE|nr:unnamed protein product [Cuscuta epithymum]